MVLDDLRSVEHGYLVLYRSISIPVFSLALCGRKDITNSTFTPIVAPDATDAIVRPLHRLRRGGLAQPAKYHFACVFFTRHRLRYPQNGTFELLHLVCEVSPLAHSLEQ